MAAAAGKAGLVKISSDTMAEVKSWSLEAGADLLDDTALGDTWKTNIVGLKEWSATIEVDWDMSDTAQVAVQNAYLNGTTVSVKLYTNNSNYYSGTANIASLSVEDPIDDLVTATLEITGSGALSYT